MSLASDPQHVLPVRQAGEELADFEDRLRNWAEKFLQTLSGDNTQLSPDLQKETAWATFESFVTLITEIILIRVALSLSFKEKYFAYKELLMNLKSQSLEPADFVVGVKFWSFLPEEIKALARTKPKKQVGGTGDPFSVKHSWKYMQEVIEEAMATLDQKHTHFEWVASVLSGVLRLCSSSNTSVKKREIEVSKYHKDGAYDSISGSSGASLEQLIVATDLSRDIQSIDPERVQMLTDFSRKWSEKMKGSGSGNIGRSNNRKNRQQRQQQSYQGQQQSDDKQQSQSSQSSGQKGGQSLCKANIDSITSTMLKM
uniref:Uncharacterized protein n=1 Tax=Chromera velia CCMP2878 TaxID=1169474 RepID=A0A0G4FZ02_9ALVE|eukprot:Cvel_19415.t1-p1 / transcript=Cvel_19415.t1 / gene=Cvel_19415 / organism=Chromera_velia_CCMP2878 / gene_product=hypothetical protein / transcript_product=hypothetical protein / location=Cvel_scaffold1672:14218-15153(+) / protein_length=312 / sequence_SO=supercontig / SO=protein_coding / is_pseudo=false